MVWSVMSTFNACGVMLSHAHAIIPSTIIPPGYAWFAVPLQVNVVAVVVAFVGAIAGGHEPLTVLQ